MKKNLLMLILGVVGFFSISASDKKQQVVVPDSDMCETVAMRMYEAFIATGATHQQAWTVYLQTFILCEADNELPGVPVIGD